MQKPEAQIMQSFIDKLCDHLPIQRVKLLIDNGFDEWETITYMKGQQLIDLGFDTQQCIVIMVAANSNARENESTHIFSEQKMQELIAKAKQNDLQKQQKMKRQQAENKKQANKQAQGSIKSVPSAQNIKEYPHKDISEALILKGTFMKPKQGQKISLNKVSVVTLEQKEITQITNLQKCPNLVNLHLGNNYIYKIEGLRELTKIKMLKLQHNNIRKIEGLQTLINLEHLYLSSNYIQRLQNLQHNKKLQQLFISKQKIKTNFTFDAQTTQALAYTLQKLQCNQNNIKNITNLKYLTVVKEVYLVKNELEDIGELSQTISGLQNLRILSFKDNPLTKSQKYRDYIVILSKTLQQLDGKPILAKEREYLVKLYALKHAKQSNEEKPRAQQKPNNMDLKGVKLQEEYGYANLNKATDLRGNGPHINTKHVRR